MTSHNANNPSRSSLINPPAIKRRVSDELPPFLGQYVPVFNEPSGSSGIARSGSGWTPYLHRIEGRLRRLGNFAKGLRLRDFLDSHLCVILIWAFVLWWGEELVFNHKIKSCAWGQWERWVSPVPRNSVSRRPLTIIALRSRSSSFGSYCGPSTGRSTHLSRTPLAALESHYLLYRSVHSKILSTHPRHTRS